MKEAVLTIGHSNHPEERFVALLRQHNITELCDVRSKPYSRFNPQFNRETLEATLREVRITYIFLGKELGARSDDPSCYENGKVQYDRIARTAPFQRGIEQVRDGVKKGLRLVLMCAEGEPLECHRTILVARHLVAPGIQVQHIHADGRLERHQEAISRLMRRLNLQELDLFRSPEEVLADAYRLQEDRIAYSLDEAQEPAGLTIRSAAG
jgi:uncharacterized protein (DUF488 family)